MINIILGLHIILYTMLVLVVVSLGLTNRKLQTRYQDEIDEKNPIWKRLFKHKCGFVIWIIWTSSGLVGVWIVNFWFLTIGLTCLGLIVLRNDYLVLKSLMKEEV